MAGFLAFGVTDDKRLLTDDVFFRLFACFHTAMLAPLSP
jgi:hypothetical protein